MVLILTQTKSISFKVIYVLKQSTRTRATNNSIGFDKTCIFPWPLVCGTKRRSRGACLKYLQLILCSYRIQAWNGRGGGYYNSY